MTNRTIRVWTVTHKTTGLLAACSDDLPGLLLTARTEAELEARLPRAISQILEAQGHGVVEVIAG